MNSSPSLSTSNRVLEGLGAVHSALYSTGMAEITEE